VLDEICEICGEYSAEKWVYVIRDFRDDTHEVHGHFKCLKKLDVEIEGIKDYKKKTVAVLLKEIKLIIKDDL
jgi:hypothetical protein